VGLAGLHPPGGQNPRIVNIGWSRKWLPLGWAGAHTDCTNQKFVRYELAKRLLPSGTDAETDPTRSLHTAAR
ncbi:MAG: hypothetical protein JSV19_00135, partial [Phycisphaerales bacterium]